MQVNTSSFWRLLLFIGCLFFSASVFAHGVDDSTKAFLEANDGAAILPFIYIGAKHMLTGYDHLLFLVGVLFFLYRPRDILIYVTCFTLGHSLTLLYGVWAQLEINPYLIDAIIGLSIVYKGFDNLGGFKQIFGFQHDVRIAVFVFGLFHGFGLATKLQEFELSQNGLLENLIGFNLGVELGQFFTLALVLIVLSFWRRFPSYLKFSTISNTLLMSCGLMLTMYQLSGYFLN